MISPETEDERNSFGGRVDFQISDRQTVLGRYMLTRTDAVDAADHHADRQHVQIDTQRLHGIAHDDPVDQRVQRGASLL